MITLQQANKKAGTTKNVARGKKGKIADQLLGAFKGVLPKGMTSTQYLRKLRNSSYGKIK